MLRAVVLLCVVLSAGLLCGPADARSRDGDRDAASQRRQDADRGEDRRDEKRRQDADRGEDRRDDKPEKRRERGEWLDQRESAKEAGRMAQTRNGGGRVLSVDPIGGGFRVKVIKDGVVRTYVVEDP